MQGKVGKAKKGKAKKAHRTHIATRLLSQYRAAGFLAFLIKASRGLPGISLTPHAVDSPGHFPLPIAICIYCDRAYSSSLPSFCTFSLRPLLPPSPAVSPLAASSRLIIILSVASSSSSAVALSILSLWHCEFSLPFACACVRAYRMNPFSLIHLCVCVCHHAVAAFVPLPLNTSTTCNKCPIWRPSSSPRFLPRHRRRRRRPFDTATQRTIHLFIPFVCSRSIKTTGPRLLRLASIPLCCRPAIRLVVARRRSARLSAQCDKVF